MQDERWKVVQEKASKFKEEQEALFNDDKFQARVKKLAAKYNLELDNDTEELIKYISAGGFVQGIEKLLDRNWAINMAIRFWASFTGRGSTKQRAFEFVCELLGLRTPGKGQNPSHLIQVAFEASKEDAEEPKA